MAAGAFVLGLFLRKNALRFWWGECILCYKLLVRLLLPPNSVCA